MSTAKIPVVEGGPAKRGEPPELVPGGRGAGSIPERSRKRGSPAYPAAFFTWPLLSYIIEASLEVHP